MLKHESITLNRFQHQPVEIEQITSTENLAPNQGTLLSGVNPEAATPLYIQIREHFQSRIQSGEYPEHTRLPSERQLAERFTVSRMTVTKAIKELEQQGWVYARKGKGTFVASRTKIDQTLETLTSFTEDMLTQGKRVSNRVIRMCIEEAERSVANELHVSPGTQLFVLERFRFANEKLISLECTTYLMPCVRKLKKTMRLNYCPLPNVKRMSIMINSLDNAPCKCYIIHVTREKHESC